jgi:hypothetical protein
MGVILVVVLNIVANYQLYLAKLFAHEEETWLLDHQDYYSFEELYIESLYYSAQTILTVGYGDHSPKNLKEVNNLYK